VKNKDLEYSLKINMESCVYVYRGYTKNFVEIKAILGISISHLNLQSILPKNTKEILLF